MQWNANGLKLRTAELRNYLHNCTQKPDIICIQETKLKNLKTYELAGFNIVRNDRNSETAAGGVATLVRLGLSFTVLEISSELESITVEVHADNKKIKIVNIYIPPKSDIDINTFRQLFPIRNGIVTGDMNGYSSLWGHPSSNSLGRMIEEIIDETDYVVMNTGEPTHQNQHGGMSALDITLCSPNIAANCSWTVNDNCTLGSDHLPTITVVGDVIHGDDNLAEKFNLKKADWKLFKAKSCDFFANVKPSPDIETLELEIRSAILEAAIYSIPKSKQPKIKTKSVPYWDGECSSNIRARNLARKKANNSKLLDDSIEYRRLKGVAQNMLKNKSREHWQSYCDSLQDNAKLGSVWKIAKKMNGLSSRSDIPGLECNGRVAANSLEKANMLADSFEQYSSTANYSETFRKHKLKCEADPQFASVRRGGPGAPM
jgi:exonuclease III